MMEMVWDEEMEEIAQRWTDQCDFGHDGNRRLLDGTYCGQNAASGYGSMNSTVRVSRPSITRIRRNTRNTLPLPARPGTARLRTWTLIVFRPTPRTVMSISLGKLDRLHSQLI